MKQERWGMKQVEWGGSGVSQNKRDAREAEST